MARPIYVPALGVRRNTVAAYRALPDRARARIMPLWTVVPRVGERTRGEWPQRDPDPDPAALDGWLTERVDALVEAMAGRAGWIDPRHVEAHGEASARALWHVATRSRLRLVTGLDRPERLQRHAADLAFLCGRGLGLRVLVDKEPAVPRAGELLALTSRLCVPPSQLDLLLDVGPVVDAERSAKSAVTAVDLLSGLRPWRSVVLVCGGFPLGPDGGDGHPFQQVPRLDRQVYETVRAARATGMREVVYGDYATDHALSADRPRADEVRPRWGLLRYTTAEHHLLARAPLTGPDRTERVRAAAHRLLRHPEFRGAAYSEGENWLHACATGTGPRGSGNLETWIRVGHIQHIAWAVEQGLRPPAGPG
ncbi:hypothetical protein [Streptomyces sp. NPDC088785]|uniref:beta family protein n=1 Tax=Streptomyces sp. NPDC088785 TaxID=3365897 RepID=UPI00382A2BFF